MCDTRKIIKNIDTPVFWNLEAGHIRGLTVNLPSKLNGSGHAENRVYYTIKKRYCKTI